MIKEKVSLFWFRRDLRFKDNIGLARALVSNHKVLPFFILDQNIIKNLNENDLRLTFIYEQIKSLKIELQSFGSDLIVDWGAPEIVISKLIDKFHVSSIYANEDYEPYAIQRDNLIKKICDTKGVDFFLFKDQVIFAKDEILTDQKKPYAVFTPYKNKWLKSLSLNADSLSNSNIDYKNFLKINKAELIPLKNIGFNYVDFTFPKKSLSVSMLKKYAQARDFPYLENATSLLGVHLRFGTISIRQLVNEVQKHSIFLSELVWREFFKQILWHFPEVEKKSYRREFDLLPWRNNKSELERWQNGLTGYPLVDAGMRELNQSGHMHNRIRMVAASFLTKHLFMHWKLGERYFADKLLDFDLSANNGNWQWVAGSGCDAAPYFRIFNPELQIKKFDPNYLYIKKWIPEFGTNKYPPPLVEHAFARDRALRNYSLLKKLKDHKR